MTSFKISEIDGVMVEKKPVDHNNPFMGDVGYNVGVDMQCSIRIKFNQKKLDGVIDRAFDADYIRKRKGTVQEIIRNAIISAGAGLLEVEK